MIQQPDINHQTLISEKKMVIARTHQKIDALRELVPDGFVFVIDTTDRSFLFKSKQSPDCEQRVISLDKMYGIDYLTKNANYYNHEDDTCIVKLSRIGQNTFIGLCAPINLWSFEKWNLVTDCLLDTVNAVWGDISPGRNSFLILFG